MSVVNDERDVLTPEEKKRQLFLSQKELLGRFLKSGAISAAQYEQSLNGLREKMGVTI